MKTDCDPGFDESSNKVAAIIARYRASGLGLKAFALEAGLPLGRLHYWIYQKQSRVSGRRGAKPTRAAVAPMFQEVKLPSRPQWGCSWAAEVSLPKGMAVRFSASTSAEWIRSVVQALQRPCCASGRPRAFFWRWHPLTAARASMGFARWFNRLKVLFQSSLGKAVHYFLNEYTALAGYLRDGRFEMDSNLVENDLRPSAVGKRRWCFIGHPDAGWRSAVIYTLIQSCRRYGINPQVYLTDVLQRLPSMTSSQVRELLPANWKFRRV
jgi:hypothetical protein